MAGRSAASQGAPPACCRFRAGAWGDFAVQEDGDPVPDGATTEGGTPSKVLSTHTLRHHDLTEACGSDAPGVFIWAALGGWPGLNRADARVEP